VRLGGHYDAAGIHFNRARQFDLGADRRVGRDAAARHANRATDRAVHGGVSCQFVVPDCGIRNRSMETQSRYLSEPAHDFGNSVVHFVQRDCGCFLDTGRNALRGGKFSHQGLAVVAQGRVAGGSAVLCDRGYYCIGRILERGDRRGIGDLGNTQIEARGLGSYIAEATTAGDFHKIVLGIGTMSLFVVVINRLFWRPLYYYAERKYRLT